MPRHNAFIIDNNPVHANGREVRLEKPYFDQDYQKPTILTDDAFTYVSFYYSTHGKAMKYNDSTKQEKYGKASRYSYEFYWKQAETFYKSSKSMPIESAPVAAYYCMLNAEKSYLSFVNEYVDDCVDNFGMHGIQEDNNDSGEDLETISIKHKQHGVFPMFAEKINPDFSTIWPSTDSKTLKSLLYNLPFVHRAYAMTYTTKKKKVEELFLPIEAGESPKYHKGNDGKAYLLFELEKTSFLANAQTIPVNIASSISPDFKIYQGRGFTLQSKNGAKWNGNGSISGEVKELTNELRKHFSYIKSNSRLWYLKRTHLGNPDVINLSTMTINMAVMHRLSEIARYKPEQLGRLMESKENWLIHEFITQSLDQFIDELAAQITRQEIMCVGVK